MLSQAALADPGELKNLSEEKLAAIMAFLVTFAHIDGELSDGEQTFISTYLDSLLTTLVDRTDRGRRRAETRARHEAELEALFEQLTGELEKLAEDVPRTAERRAYMYTRLKVRCVELFRWFDAEEQARLIGVLDGLVLADGCAAPEEQLLRDELVSLIAQAPPSPAPRTRAHPLTVTATTPIVVGTEDHPWLQLLEQPFSPHPIELAAQLERDHALVGQTLLKWSHLRSCGHGALTGKQHVDQLPRGCAFLDGYVHVLRPDPGTPLDLIVVGDLHGCYSCLKAVLLQSDFLPRVWAHQRDPLHHRDVKLVFLGDYLDRGRFGFDGVLRTVLQLYVSMPEHVIVLRGNHEHLLEVGDGFFLSAVQPAESLATLVPHAPAEMIEAYWILFESMPTSLLCDRTLFVHGGIPRDDTFADRYRDLSSLNDPELRFQMMWSDPSPAEHIPVMLQRENPRFSFGRNQFRQFMERIGCHTMVRGHEQVLGGFEKTYDLGDLVLLNLFSAGGLNNPDLPPSSGYRSVHPMALSMTFADSRVYATPWPIDWASFSSPTRNGMLRPAPKLETQSV